MSKQKSYKQLGLEFYEQRSEKTYKALYDRVRPGLKSYVWNILKDNEAVEDVLANTLLKLWTKIDQYKPKYQITTWLYRIAFNESLGYIRERNKKYSLSSMQEFGIEVSANNTISENLAMLVEEAEMKTENDFWEEENELMERYYLALKCIDALKPMYRDILSDRLIGKMKYEDIAEKHNVPLQTVKNRIRRGKSLIIEAMGS
jgi:RNA polymerase sigma-70 factor (ECF subfamily)